LRGVRGKTEMKGLSSARNVDKVIFE